jgi:hypothetical protein
LEGKRESEGGMERGRDGERESVGEISGWREREREVGYG